MANPGWHGQRHVQVGNLSAGFRVNGAGRLSCHLPARTAHLLGFRALLGRWVWWQGKTRAFAGYVEDVPSEIGSGVIELSCTDMSGLLDQMQTPRTYRQTSSAPGALIGRAIKDSGADTGTWFSRYLIDEHGAPLTVEWRGEQTSTVVRSLANGAGGQWYVEVESDKTLTFVYKIGPIDRRGSILLVEGHNVLSGSIRPSIARLVNDLLGIANDRDWQRAAGARVIDGRSVRLYGRRRATRRYIGHTRSGSLETAARADLAALSSPSGPVSLEISDRNRIVSDLAIGQLVTLWSTTQNRIYDVTISGIAEEPTRGIVTVVGTAVEVG